MIRAGLAWHYKRFDSTPAYAAAESEAQIDFCGKAWDSAGDIQEIRNSTNSSDLCDVFFISPPLGVQRECGCDP